MKNKTLREGNFYHKNLSKEIVKPIGEILNFYGWDAEISKRNTPLLWKAFNILDSLGQYVNSLGLPSRYVIDVNEEDFNRFEGKFAKILDYVEETYGKKYREVKEKVMTYIKELNKLVYELEKKRGSEERKEKKLSFQKFGDNLKSQLNTEDYNKFKNTMIELVESEQYVEVLNLIKEIEK